MKIDEKIFANSLWQYVVYDIWISLNTTAYYLKFSTHTYKS